MQNDQLPNSGVALYCRVSTEEQREGQTIDSQVAELERFAHENILGSFAEFERELIADRTRRGRRHKVEVRGQHVGALPPYGFKYIPKFSSAGEIGHLELLPDEAAIVRQMYNWVDQEGISTRKVVSRLNEIGIRPRKRGKRWQSSSVRRILRSEVYSGVWHYNKHLHCEPANPSPHKYRKSLRTSLRLRARSEWIPVPLPDELKIVDRSVWVRVQQQIDRNTSLSLRNTKHFYLLRGMPRCGGCQAAYVRKPRRGVFGYRCINRCRRYPGIKEEFLNDTVWNAVKSWLEKPEIIESGINSVVQSNQREIQSGIGHDARALEQIQTEETRIVQAYRLGVLTSDQLREELKGLQARRALVNHGERKKTVKIGIEAVHRSLEDYRQHISERLEMLSKEQRREILQHLVIKIIFEGERVKIIGRVAVSPDAATARVAGSAYAPSPDAIEHTNTVVDTPKSDIADTTSWDCAPLSPVECCRKSKFSRLYLSEPGEYPEAHAAQRQGYPRIYEYLAERFSRNNLRRRGPKVRTGSYGTLRTACQTERRVRSVAGSRKPER